MSPPLPDLSNCKKIGFIVPSSNTAVEPITNAIFQSLEPSDGCDIICLFTRIQVKTVGTDAASTSQFSTETLVEAACLLADAQVDAILWNGTSGMWVGSGLDADRKLAQAMQEATGIPCSTTTIATIEALKSMGKKCLSIAVPYTVSLTAKLVEFYEGCGYKVAAAERLITPPKSNIEIAKSETEDIIEVIKRANVPDSDAIVVACTNWPASALVEDLEKDSKMATIVDSITVTTWWALHLIHFRGTVRGWGMLMGRDFGANNIASHRSGPPRYLGES